MTSESLLQHTERSVEEDKLMEWALEEEATGELSALRKRPATPPTGGRVEGSQAEASASQQSQETLFADSGH